MSRIAPVVACIRKVYILLTTIRKLLIKMSSRRKILSMSLIFVRCLRNHWNIRLGITG